MTQPSEQLRHAMKPSRWVLFARTFFLYQLWRFIWINLRMIRMIWLSHRQMRSLAPRAPGSAKVAPGRSDYEKVTRVQRAQHP